METRIEKQAFDHYGNAYFNVILNDKILLHCKNNEFFEDFSPIANELKIRADKYLNGETFERFHDNVLYSMENVMYKSIDKMFKNKWGIKTRFFDKRNKEILVSVYNTIDTNICVQIASVDVVADELYYLANKIINYLNFGYIYESNYFNDESFTISVCLSPYDGKSFKIETSYNCDRLYNHVKSFVEILYTMVLNEQQKTNQQGDV